MNCLQYAQKSIKKASYFFTNSTQKYILGLLLSTGKKNCTAMSSDLGVPYNSIYKYFDDFEYQKDNVKNFLVNMVKLYATKENPGILVADTSQILKLYAKKIRVLCYGFNNSIKFAARGISCVTSVWTNGKIVIPLSFDFWIRKKDLKDDEKYRKKTEISKELILELKDKIPFAYVVLDGEYGNKDFLSFLHDNNLYYSIRMPKNRKVIINEQELSLKDQPLLKHKRNERYKSAKGSYKGICSNFISHKRNGKNGTKQVVFIVSNLEAFSPKEHVEAYSGRWPIEKMFRTLKQSLRLQQCQSTSTKKQRAHIFATFLAFAELEIQKNNKKKRSPEQILKIIRAQKPVKTKPQIHLWEGFIM